jgi:hypothetical protein
VPLREWIPIVVLYLVGLGFFRLLGGFAAAGRALERWGRGSSTMRTNPGSSG